MEVPVQRGSRLWTGDGLAIYATDVAGKAIMEWEDPAACAAAHRLNDLLKRHALATNYVERYDRQALLVRQVEPLPFHVMAEAKQGDSTARFAGPDGPLERHDLKKINGVTKARVEMMEDVAAHAARSLRAHLMPRGIEHLRLHLQFGLADDGACLLQVVNPLVCDLGTTDMEGLANLLGG